MHVSLIDIREQSHIYSTGLICYTRFPFSQLKEERNLLIYHRLDLSLQLAVSRVAILSLSLSISLSLCSGLRAM